MQYAAGIPDDYFDDFKRKFSIDHRDGFTHMMLANLHFPNFPSGLDQFQNPVLVVTGSKEYKQMKESSRDLLGLCRMLMGWLWIWGIMLL